MLDFMACYISPGNLEIIAHGFTRQYCLQSSDLSHAPLNRPCCAYFTRVSHRIYFMQIRVAWIKWLQLFWIALIEPDTVNDLAPRNYSHLQRPWQTSPAPATGTGNGRAPCPASSLHLGYTWMTWVMVWNTEECRSLFNRTCDLMSLLIGLLAIWLTQQETLAACRTSRIKKTTKNLLN